MRSCLLATSNIEEVRAERVQTFLPAAGLDWTAHTPGESRKTNGSVKRGWGGKRWPACSISWAREGMDERRQRHVRREVCSEALGNGSGGTSKGKPFTIHSSMRPTVVSSCCCKMGTCCLSLLSTTTLNSSSPCSTHVAANPSEKPLAREGRLSKLT